MFALVVVASLVNPGLQCCDINCRPVVSHHWPSHGHVLCFLLKNCCVDMHAHLVFWVKFLVDLGYRWGGNGFTGGVSEVLHLSPDEPHYFGRVGGISRSKSVWSEGFQPVFGFWAGPGCSVPGDTANCPDLPTYDSAGAPGTAPLPLADAEPPPVLSLGGAASAPSSGLPAISSLPGIGALTAAAPAGTCACAQGAGENTCPAGYMGANCDACVSDDVCKTQTGDSAATCHKGFDYTE